MRPEDRTKTDLKALAEHLALNYFNSCSIDIYPDQRGAQKDKLIDLKEKVFEDKGEFELSNIENNTPYRNILVIGAGATSNAFSDIPLATKAISDIQEKIVLQKVPIEGTDLEFTDLNFDYFIKFYQLAFPEVSQIFNWKPEDLTSTFNDADLNRYLADALNVGIRNPENLENLTKLRGLGKLGKKQEKEETINFLSELGKKYFDHYQKLILYSSDEEVEAKIDFETSLYLLSEIFTHSTIRRVLKEIYDVRHGPTLFYQIAAHLFKNGFLDVIINFNFDELLDQAIEDEVDENGYDKILSDGDCRPLKELFTLNKLRQPLYIKPHGTTGHSSSLRFTKNQYHELPQDMREFLEGVISNEDKDSIFEDREPTKRAGRSEIKVNLIVVGFGMKSLEFNDIVSSKMPEGSNVFMLYNHESEDDEEIRAKCDHKKESLEKLFKAKKRKPPEFHFIGHEFYKDYTVLDKHYTIPDKHHTVPAKDYDYTSLGHTFNELYGIIGKFFKPAFKPPPINTHLIVSSFFGTRNFWHPLTAERSSREAISDKTKYPRSYFKSEDITEYYKDRVLLEILLSMLANNGQLDSSLLMNGNTGYYYSLYFDNAGVNKADGESKAEPLEALIRKFVGNEVPINPFEITNLSINDHYEALVNQVLNPKKLFSKKLEDFINDLEGTQKTYLKACFQEIKQSNNSKIQGRYRSTTHHIFKDYSKTDLITNHLGYNLNFYDGLYGFIGNQTGKKKQRKSSNTNKIEVNTICVIADYGYQIKHFIQEIIEKGQIEKIFVVLACPYTSKEELGKDGVKGLKKAAYARFSTEKTRSQVEAMVKVRFRYIKRHNHHMAIFMEYDHNGKPGEIDFDSEQKKVYRALYHYKRGLTETINPIRLKLEENKKYLLQKFKYYADRAEAEFPIGDKWITDSKDK